MLGPSQSIGRFMPIKQSTNTCRYLFLDTCFYLGERFPFYHSNASSEQNRLVVDTKNYNFSVVDKYDLIDSENGIFRFFNRLSVLSLICLIPSAPKC